MVVAPDRLPAGPLTYRDYTELPEDGRRYEILDGELDVTPSPMIRHQVVVRNLFRLLDRHVDERLLGTLLFAPTDLILADTTVTVPDILFVAADRSSVITERAIEGPPDLVVEIISPSTRRKDRSTKAALYARYGVRCYWIVDPEAQSFEAFVLDGSAYRLAVQARVEDSVTAEPFPDLRIPLLMLWS